MSRGTTHRTVRIEDGLWEAAKESAAKRGDNLSEVIRRSLASYINERPSMNISDEARRAATSTYMEVITDLRLSEGGGFKVASQQRRAMDAALEAAAPHLMAAALDEAADNFEVRSGTFLATMKNMTGLPEYTHDDILRYGAYSAEAQTAAIRLRSSAQAYRSAGAGE